MQCGFCKQYTTNEDRFGRSTCDDCNAMLDIGLYPDTGLDALETAEIEAEQRYAFS